MNEEGRATEDVCFDRERDDY